MLGLFEELFGSAEPAIPGDNLDVTKPTEESNDHDTTPGPEHMVAQTSFSESESFRLLEKVVFFCAIVGVVALFLRTRRSHAPLNRFPA